ncbi:MAG: acyl-CoA synthetase [Candidatus Bathyarchaeia archaeon]
MVLMEKYGPPKEMWPEFKLDLPEAKNWPAKLNITEMLIDKNIFRGMGEKTAILHEDQRITFNQLRSMVDSFGSALKFLGVEPQDRVIIRLPNTPEFVVSHLAVQKIGAVSVPAFPLYKAGEIEYIANNCEAKIVITAHDSAGEVVETRGRLQTVKHIILVGDDAKNDKCNLKFSRLIQEFSDSRLNATRMDLDDVSLLLYTSGTTGLPKGCIHTQRDYLAIGECYFKRVLLLNENDVCGGPASLAFAFGHGMLLSLYFGGAISLYGNRKFEPTHMFGLIEKHGITVLFAVPSAYKAMLTRRSEGDRHKFSCLRTCISAGEHLSPSLYTEIRQFFGCEVLNGIGTTELLHIFISARFGSVKPGSLGTPVPYYDVRIVNDEGVELPPSKVGYLAVKGPVGARYWRRNDEQAKYVKYGFNYTGDLAYKDEDGFFWFMGRDDDLIKTAGYRVSPQEVEDILSRHPAVFEAAVIGKPDPERGQIVKAFVVLKPGVNPCSALYNELISFVRSYLAPYKTPREIEFADSLPKTLTGKVKRKELLSKENQKGM